MYGAVSATLRRLGVRQAPFSASKSGASGRSTYHCRESSPLKPLHLPVRRNLFGLSGDENLVPCSRRRPSHAPNGGQMFIVVSEQSQALPPWGQSVVRGTAVPVWGTPISWNSSSVSCGPEWQSTHAPLPTNSRAPRLAAAEIRVESRPSLTNLSKGELRLMSWCS